MDFKNLLKFPQVNIEHILLVFGTLIFALIVFIIYSNITEKRSKRSILLESYLRRFKFNKDHKQILRTVFKRVINIDTSRFFKYNDYYNYVTNKFLYDQNKRGVADYILNETANLFTEINGIIDFNKRVIFSSKDIQPGSLIKVEIPNEGLFTGEIIHNYENGLMLKLPYIDILKKNIGKKTPVKIHYWNEYEYYEIDTVIKSISLIDYPLKYILIAHENAVASGLYPKGMRTESDIPVFFRGIFDSSISGIIENQSYKGTIVSLSFVGAEIITKNNIHSDSIIMFNFNALNEDKIDSFHFSGRVIESQNDPKGYRLFVKYLDMDDNTREFINKFVCKQVECIPGSGV